MPHFGYTHGTEYDLNSTACSMNILFKEQDIRKC